MKTVSEIRFFRVVMILGSVFLLILLIMISYFQTNHEKDFMENLCFSAVVDAQKINLVPWEDEEEEIYYLFVPSGWKEKNLEFTVEFTEGLLNFQIDDRYYQSGDELQLVYDDFEDDIAVQMQLSDIFGISYMDKPLKILYAENIPTLLVTVEDAEDLLSETEYEKKKYIETGELLVLDETGEILDYQKLAQFKVRGNLTATLDKKPFKMVLEQAASMLGMNAALKWNLLANATDGSYIRNKLVLDLANETVDTYEPDGEFVNLFLNGSYQGLYLLTEAVETGENRLNLPSEEHLLEMELDFRMEEGTVYVTTERGQIFAVGKEKEISDQEAENVRIFLNDIESALFSADGISTVSGRSLEELIDMDSWANAWLIQEISGDHDTGIASQYAYTKTENGNKILYAGPVWDFDGTMGNVNTPMFKIPNALITSIEQTREEGNANQNRWLAAMYRNETFRKIVEEKYSTIFNQKLEQMVETQIDEYVFQINRAACLDALRWHDKRLEWEFALPDDLEINECGDYKRYDTLESHVSMVKNFLAKKRSFLYGLFIEHKDYCIVEIRNDAPFLNQDYNQTLYIWVERGTAIGELPEYTAEGYEWKGYYDSESGSLVTCDTIIKEDCVLNGIWEDAG